VKHGRLGLGGSDAARQGRGSARVTGAAPAGVKHGMTGAALARRGGGGGGDARGSDVREREAGDRKDGPE
jgi:hypothetical protein